MKVSEYQNITFEVTDGVARVGFGKGSTASVAILDEETLGELGSLVEEIRINQKKFSGLIFYSHIKDCFLAGADIKLIHGLKSEGEAAQGAQEGQGIFNKIEELKIPTVTLVDGVCLGGGLELALATGSIIVGDNPRALLGLPEVKLGILPAFGGTYRLPRRVGQVSGLKLILSGNRISAAQALKMGLVDGVYPSENLMAVAPRHFKKRKKTSLKDSLKLLAQENFFSRKIVFQKARENVLKKTRGLYEAPLKILSVMESGLGKSKKAYLQGEAQAFGELCLGRQSKNLRELFFSTERAKKGPETTTPPLPLARGGTLGAGVMGGGITWLMAQNDMMPIMKDISWKSCEIGLLQGAKSFQSLLGKKRITPTLSQRRHRSIRPQLDYRGFKKIDLLVEAVVEDMEVKRLVLTEAEQEVRKDALIVTNTSSLSVTQLATYLKWPSRFAGLHFFNPVDRMPLVEIISHPQVAPETLNALHHWVKKTKKTPLIVGDGPGFLVNRILMPYLGEAVYLLEEGLGPREIDGVALNFGMPMGPCRLLDEIGLDVASKVSHILHEGLGDRVKGGSFLEKMVEMGLVGKKRARGFYHYDERGVAGGINPKVNELLGTRRKKIKEREMEMRLFLPMINEAAHILGEGIVQTPEAVDLGAIMGIGFPPFRGGPLRYADSEGLMRIYDSLTHLAHDVDPLRYAPAPFIKDLVMGRKSFYQNP